MRLVGVGCKDIEYDCGGKGWLMYDIILGAGRGYLKELVYELGLVFILN